MVTKKAFITILLFLLILPVSASIQSVPTSLDVEWSKGDDQPDNEEITLSHDINSSVSYVIDISGDSYFSVSQKYFALKDLNDDQKIILYFDIPTSASIGEHKGNLEVYDEDGYLQKKIPVYMDVNPGSSSQDECYISTTFGQYAKSLKKGSNAYSEGYTFTISPGCEGGVDITDIYVSGQVTQTEAGSVPIRLSGGIPVGKHDAESSFKVNLEFDSSELALGTYETSLIVGGVWKGNTVSEKIDFDITVVGEATPIPDKLEPPTFDSIPSELITNETYTITARNVNPNIKVKIEPNEFIKGISAKMDGTTWTYEFSATKIGATTLRLWAEYEGGQIGNTYEQDVKIKPTAGAMIGDSLKFRFYPELYKLDDGDTLSVLVMDADTNKTVNKKDLELFVNGELSNGTFIVKKNTQYELIASVVGYPGINEVFTVSPKHITISYDPLKPRKGDTVVFTTDPANATLWIGDTKIDKNYIFSEMGTHEIKATSDGYVNSYKNVTVYSLIELIYSPNVIDKDKDGTPELKKGEFYNLEFNMDTNSSVVFRNPDGMTNTIANGDKKINFEADKKGQYIVKSGDETIATYEVEGFIFEWWYALVAGIIIFALVLLAYFRNVGKNSEVKSTYFEHKGQDVDRSGIPEDFEGD